MAQHATTTTPPLQAFSPANDANMSTFFIRDSQETEGADNDLADAQMTVPDSQEVQPRSPAGSNPFTSPAPKLKPRDAPEPDEDSGDDTLSAIPPLQALAKQGYGIFLADVDIRNLVAQAYPPDLGLSIDLEELEQELARGQDAADEREQSLTEVAEEEALAREVARFTSLVGVKNDEAEKAALSSALREAEEELKRQAQQAEQNELLLSTELSNVRAELNSRVEQAEKDQAKKERFYSAATATVAERDALRVMLDKYIDEWKQVVKVARDNGIEPYPLPPR
ncbi:hypothetical protein LTR53_012115 [Teratosphaeriaceae sp. CCFEE 6253]|nr:hypothetical protein LTR53_012115 [Teratosphaeriaceae sp. CCFEE 6253]